MKSVFKLLIGLWLIHLGGCDVRQDPVAFAKEVCIDHLGVKLVTASQGSTYVQITCKDEVRYENLQPPSKSKARQE